MRASNNICKSYTMPTRLPSSLPFRMIPGTKPESLKIAKTGQRARSYAGRDPGHLLAFEIRCSSTREYPSLIHTFFMTHTVGGVFVRDEDRALYDEMLRLQRLGSNTKIGVPYIEEEIIAIIRKGKQRAHLPVVGSVLSGRATDGCPPPPQSTVDPADVKKLKKIWGAIGSAGGCGDDGRATMMTAYEDEEDDES
ncbi:hypothetical protein Tco_0715248 [Tanacetum coccineum]